jgi:hypothetical protein
VGKVVPKVTVRSGRVKRVGGGVPNLIKKGAKNQVFLRVLGRHPSVSNADFMAISHPIGNSAFKPDNARGIHKQFVPFTSEAVLYNRDGKSRPITMLRDSASMQTILSKACVHKSDYVDTCEYRYIQGVLGVPQEVPLVEICIATREGKRKVLCGLVGNLPQGIDVLVGNDFGDILPVHVGVTTRAQMRVQQEAIEAETPAADSVARDDRGAEDRGAELNALDRDLNLDALFETE